MRSGTGIMAGVHQATLRKWVTHAGWRTAGRTLSDFGDFYNRNCSRHADYRIEQEPLPAWQRIGQQCQNVGPLNGAGNPAVVRVRQAKVHQCFDVFNNASEITPHPRKISL